MQPPTYSTSFKTASSLVSVCESLGSEGPRFGGANLGFKTVLCESFRRENLDFIVPTSFCSVSQKRVLPDRVARVARIGHLRLSCFGILQGKTTPEWVQITKSYQMAGGVGCSS